MFVLFLVCLSFYCFCFFSFGLPFNPKSLILMTFRWLYGCVPRMPFRLSGWSALELPMQWRHNRTIKEKILLQVIRIENKHRCLKKKNIAKLKFGSQHFSSRWKNRKIKENLTKPVTYRLKLKYRYEFRPFRGFCFKAFEHVSQPW